MWSNLLLARLSWWSYNNSGGTRAYVDALASSQLPQGSLGSFSLACWVGATTVACALVTASENDNKGRINASQVNSQDNGTASNIMVLSGSHLPDFSRAMRVFFILDVWLANR
jgi:hypothetical protein